MAHRGKIAWAISPGKIQATSLILVSTIKYFPRKRKRREFAAHSDRRTAAMTSRFIGRLRFSKSLSSPAPFFTIPRRPCRGSRRRRRGGAFYKPPTTGGWRGEICSGKKARRIARRSERGISRGSLRTKRSDLASLYPLIPSEDCSLSIDITDAALMEENKRTFRRLARKDAVRVIIGLEEARFSARLNRTD